MANNKTILVAPLNWGLGHATRCIPIIHELLLNKFNVIIASDGNALKLLLKEFPSIEYFELPSYNITYPKNGNLLIWNLLLKLPAIKKAIASENKIVQKLVSENKIQGIISDNRFGVRSSKIPSVYITHQLNVLSGKSTFITSKIHQIIIKKFAECWVPDAKGDLNLSGKLSLFNNPSIPIKHLGTLSRMKKRALPKKYDILMLLSGPEPQRTFLEKQLVEEFKNDSRSILLIQGIVEKESKTRSIDHITCVNFMIAKDLEAAINQSELIIARSGFTTIMDLSVLEKKAFFIPTPGQSEQEYLASRMDELKKAPYCNQKDFSKEKLEKAANYSGLSLKTTPINYKELFSLFESE